jgi:prepilin-type N-terminal cleavage/methylation domain-containing protein
MRKDGFTLIELMIVIAILAIVLLQPFKITQDLFRETRRADRTLDRQERITHAFHCLKRALSETTSLDYVGDDEIRLHGPIWRTLLRRPEGTGWVLEGENGTPRIDLNLGDSLQIGTFHKVNDRFFWCPIRFEDGTTFPMFWRCGR